MVLAGSDRLKSMQVCVPKARSFIGIGMGRHSGLKANKLVLNNTSSKHILENCVNCKPNCIVIVLQRYSVFDDSLCYCKYLPITKIFLDNYL